MLSNFSQSVSLSVQAMGRTRRVPIPSTASRTHPAEGSS